MECAAVRLSRAFFSYLVLCLFLALTAFGQGSDASLTEAPKVPPNFTLDLQTAARLRPQLIEQSTPAMGPYSAGRQVFDRLIEYVPKPSAIKLLWDLRIVEDDQFNAYSSPDGTIYVETGLAQLAGKSAGLWAAILSHEIAHVARRDWARRYLYQKSLERDSAVPIVLGDPGLPSGSWTDSQKASDDLGRLCRQMEVDADREGLMLMARAGYHPDFVPALHHLLHAQSSASTPESLYAMHPCWEERDRELSRAYIAASIEFEHRWPEWFASPGGNPPTVIFADQPVVRKMAAKEKTDSEGKTVAEEKSSRVWEIEIPMRCENLVGAVEVVLRAGSARGKSTRDASPSESVAPGEFSLDRQDSGFEIRQLTGCTSPRTTVTFALGGSPDRRNPETRWTDVYILDAWGAVLARAEIPKLGR